MRKRIAAVAVAVSLAMAGCGESGRWKDRGFDSEAECWLNHGWDGSVADGVDRHDLWDYWCG